MTILAPYFYSWALNNPNYKVGSLCEARKSCGLGAATFAFILGGSFGVTGGSGKVNPEIAQCIEDIKGFVKAGGTMILSFGGASGPYLEETINDSEKLFAVWDEIITATGVTSFDFDVEGAYIENQQQNRVRIGAMKLLQKKYPAMYISYTLAVMPPDAYGNESLGAPQMTLIKNTLAAGVRLSLINMMTMDYYQQSNVSMGDRAIACAESVHRQLSQLFPQHPSKTVYSMIGITPMAGVNDDLTVFSEADARTVSKYAGEKGIGLVSYWALQRDQVGTGELAIYSRVNSADFAFHAAFASGLGKTAPPPQAGSQPVPVPAPSPGPPVVPKPQPGPRPQPKDEVSPWTPGTKYAKGEKVSYNGSVFVCLTAHRSQSDWKPTITAALWTKVNY